MKRIVGTKAASDAPNGPEREADAPVQPGVGAEDMAGVPPAQSSAPGAESRRERARAEQIALPFAYRPRFGRSDFVAARSNAAARAWVLDAEALWRWPEGRMALWGASGTGKTHLLSVWAARHGAPVIEGSRLNERDVADLFSEGGFRALALDNADHVRDEHDLLHLINLVREQRMALLLAARLPPARWAIRLPDLASRVRATASVPIGQAEEELLHRLFLRLLAERQIVVAQPVTEWLLRRLPRNARAIRDMAALLDQAALASGGKVTRALAGSMLETLRQQETDRD
ncbi:Chromosomal replication initiator protein DnaA [Acetobacter tropicalis]|uniref:Chromosomal replication initiator protein DnaA n=2 Tax=Acetobacter tropicalis TaxID=104102 RepID=A0A094YVM7_9PROT|nr:chromosomal replication initiator DnaA [Acetobacter tropicalis]KGB26060.1 Chromosomal replication initiator protein DnaA [Acetobacter tropicalis]MBC9008259.1 chromosomal replication initiator DnaA [Acetobacter tropicalis]MDO8170550.1 chromosomal replication initiator DnaA [Acetobacter tropicalis]